MVLNAGFRERPVFNRQNATSGEESSPQTDSVSEGEGLWSSIKEAISGSHHRDYTQGSIGKSILLLAIPMVLEMIMESVFAVVDIFWVARLGTDAAATVGLTESLLTLIYALAIGLSIGATATVARRIGERNPDGAARAAVQSILIALLVSIVIAAIGTPLAPRLLKLMGGSPWVIEHGASFTRVMLAGNVTVVMFFMVNAIFRGSGDAAIAMRTLWLANWINIILGPCLIFGLGPFPKLGIVGAAIATNIGRGTGALFALSKLLKPGGRFEIRREHLKVRTCNHDEADQAVGNGNVSGLHRNGKLDRFGSDHFQLWEQCSCRIHIRHSRDSVRPSSVVGNGERSGDDGWTIPWSTQSRTCRTSCLAGGLLQHDLPGSRLACCLYFSLRRSSGFTRAIRTWRVTEWIACGSLLTASSSMRMEWYSVSRLTERVTRGLLRSSISSSFGCGRYRSHMCLES